MVKHFLKTLLIFIGMILLGVVGILLVNYFDDKGGELDTPESAVAK